METTGVYYYNVQNTNAEDLYDVLVDIVANINESGGISVNIDGTQKKTAATAEKKETDESAEKNTGAEQPFKAKMLTNEDIVTPRKGKASKSKKASNGEAGSLVVDKARNALIYQGSAPGLGGAVAHSARDGPGAAHGAHRSHHSRSHAFQ